MEKGKIGVTFIFVPFQNWMVMVFRLISIILYGRFSFLNK